MVKRSLWNILLIILTTITLSTFFLPGKAMAWSAVVGNRTHTDIVNAAYSILENDPAFHNIKFPSLDNIQNWDWVSPVTRNGTGPDVVGTTNCGDHYYNPRLEAVQTKAGGGPDAVNIQFSNLLGGYANGNSNLASKSASWAAHYIADMTVPYHTQGTYRSDIMKIYNAAGGKNAKTVPLPAYITGPLGLSAGHPNDFKKEIEAWLTGEADHVDTEDWFDPWYWNGSTNHPMELSSHVTYEAGTFAVPGSLTGMIAAGDLGGAVKRYSTLWTNITPTFDSVESKQEGQIHDFARKMALIAQKTTDSLNGQVPSATPYLVSAIEGAATVWRASFTGLSPTLSFSIPDKNEPQKLRVTGTLTNMAGETVKNVHFRITVTGGTLKSKAQDPDDIPGGWHVPLSWDVEASNIGYCSFKLEVIGQYVDTPDLQYAVTQVTAPGILPVTSKTASAKLDHSIVFCVDNSDSMKGQPIIDAMNAGVAAVKAAPYGSVEMALYFFGQNGCDPPFRVLDFTLDHDSVRAAIQTAAARGNTPLAAMITMAGQYIQSSARGQEGTIILLTDGMETCNGDPIGAARALNPNLKLKTGLFTKPLYAANSIPIKLQVVGFNIAAAGTETTLKQIAAAGNGNYYPANNMQELSNALTQVVKEASNKGINFQTWWFIAGGAALLLLIILLARRGKPKAAPAVAVAGAPNTVQPQMKQSPAVSTPLLASASFCSNCGARIQAGAAFCTGCGKPIMTQGPAFCPRCGTQVTSRSAFCSKCGDSLTVNMPYPAAQTIQTTTIPPQLVASQKTVRKVSGAWWLLAFFLLLPGGLIAWAVVKKEHPQTARAMLMVSLMISALFFYGIVQNIINR
jgi:Mg-chelatase subunit ChlD